MPKKRSPETTRPDSAVETPAAVEHIDEVPTAELATGAAEERAENEAMEKSTTQSGIEQAREMIERSRRKKKEPEPEEFAPETYGAFSDQKDKGGKIVLTKEQQGPAHDAIERFSADVRFSPPSLAIGQKVATEYDSRTRSFATRSKIEILPDGKKVFIVTNYPTAVIHRLADAFGNWLSGSKMAKAITNREWKRRYEGKSRIPTIENNDPRTVVTPFLENVNAADYFSFSREMKDLGGLEELKNDGVEEKIEIAGRIIDELGKIHAEGAAWGEFIPDNVIITKGGKPVITESEVAYYDDVPLLEQKARDMRDFIISAGADLQKGEKLTDYAGFAKTLLDRHPDPKVRQETVRLAKEKPSWWRKALRAVHELPRLGVGGKEYDKIVAAIASTEI